MAVIPRTLLSRRLAHPSQPGERVLLTMGMPGTGKTTLVKGGLGKAFYSVVDSPLGSFELARQLVKEIQSSGRGVSFLLAWRSIPEAVFGMLERAMPGHEERAVALLDMADLVLKCLDTFQQLADFNRFDGDVTLDVVHTRSHVRTWCHGAEAANFMIPAVRNVLLGHPQGILGQVLTAWKSALRSCSKPIPEALRAVAELGVNLGSVGEEIMAKSLDNEVDGTVQPFKATFKAIHSLQDIPGWKESIPGFLRTADKYEASLRAADGGAY